MGANWSMVWSQSGSMSQPQQKALAWRAKNQSSLQEEDILSLHMYLPHRCLMSIVCPTSGLHGAY